MKKIFFNDRYIVFASACEKIETAQTYELNNINELPHLLHTFNKNGTESLKIICENTDDIFDEFSNLFNVIMAGGGVVRNSSNEILLIFRYGKWDLPKGKQEIGESIRHTALREVQEECGANNLQLGSFITETNHCYVLDGHLAMKRTYWYNMLYCGNPNALKPQTEEDISQTKFVAENNLSEYLKNTYASIREVFLEIQKVKND